jgi:HEAT repeat protein/beta-lactamase regulating signal transducer with metallopeptidase domain
MIHFTDAVLEPALWFLADWSLRWAVLIGLLAAWFRVRPPRRAATRHLLCSTVLLAGLLIPALPRWGAGFKMLDAPQAALSQPETLNRPEVPVRIGDTSPPVESEPDAPARVDAVARPFSRVGLIEQAPAAESVNALPVREPLGARRVFLLLLAALWTAGVLLFLARGLGGWLLLERLRRMATPVHGPPARLFETCRAELGLRRQVSLATHPAVSSPITLGLFRSIILVPVTWTEVPADAQRGSLLHELAHVTRYDAWLALALEGIRAFFFFHPCLHWLIARLEREREFRCDETVIARGIEPQDYARILLDFSRQPGQRLPFAFGYAYPPRIGRRRTVKARIHHLLEENMNRWITPLRTGQALALGALVLGLALGLGSFRLWATAADDAPPTTAGTTQAADDFVAAAAEDDPPKGQDEKPQRVKKEKLRYGGKGFQQWREELETELKPALRAEAIAALSTFGVNGYAKEAVPIIIEVARGMENDLITDTARTGLINIGPPAVEALIDELSNGMAKGRIFALYVLMNMGASAKAAAPAVAKAVTDEDATVRNYAIVALPRINRGAKDLVPALVKGFQDANHQNRMTVVRALAEIGASDKQVVPALVEALKNDDAETRSQAAQVLGNMLQSTAVQPGRGRRGGPEPVVQVLEPKESHTQAEVAALIATLNDKVPSVRQSAWSALQQMRPDPNTTDSILVEALKGTDRSLRNDVLRYMSGLGPGAVAAVPALIKVLKEGETNERHRAIQILANVGPAAKEAIPALTALIQDENPGVSKAAVEALRRITKAKPTNDVSEGGN